MTKTPLLEHPDEDEISLELDLSTQFRMDVGWLKPPGAALNGVEASPMPLDTPVELEQPEPPRRRSRRSRSRPRPEPTFTDAELAAYRVYRRRRVRRSAFSALVVVAILAAALTEVSRQRNETLNTLQIHEALTKAPAMRR